MDIKQLKYFLAIAEEGQITSAAKRLHIAQPPLSQQLKLLETELGVKLVERGSRSIKLTDAGELLKIKAQQIIELSDSAVDEITDFSKGLKGTLSIGMVSSSGISLLNDKISDFHKQHYGVKFSIHEGNTFVTLDKLHKGIIELGIVRTPFSSVKLGYKYMKLEPMIAVMTTEHLFNYNNSHISIDELKGKPLILYRRFEQLISEVCYEHGFEPELLCKNDDARTTLMWAKKGLGIGLVPKSSIELIDSSNLFYKEIDEERLFTRLAVIWLKDKHISPLAAKFIESFE